MERTELDKRKGIIRCTFEFLKNSEFELLSLIFSRIIPINIEISSDYFSPYVQYNCISPEFDIIQEGEIVPVYDLIITVLRKEFCIYSHESEVKTQYDIKIERT